MNRETIISKEQKMMIDEINEDLKYYDLVFLIDDESVAKQFCGSEIFTESKKYIKIYLPYMLDVKNPMAIFRSLSNEEREDILNLYFLYEFSDRFILLSESSCYGGLFNYVEAGWLTLNEVFNAFLN